MKKVILHLTLYFIAAFSSTSTYALPYSTSNEIQVYTNVSDELLSSFARECIEKSQNKGVMNQLSNNLGCSNFRTAAKVCGCVDRVFSKDKVKDLINGEESALFSSFLDQSGSINVDALSPSKSFLFRLKKLYSKVEELGLSKCTLPEDNYTSSLSISKGEKVLNADVVKKQNVLFNSELKKINKERPSHEELLTIAAFVSSKSNEKFALESTLKDIIKDKNERSSSVISGINQDIVDEYIGFHLREITAGADPLNFDISQLKHSDSLDSERKSCAGIALLIAAQKEKDIEDNVRGNLDIFFPDSSIEKAPNTKAKDQRTSEIESTIGRVLGALAMSGLPEHKKDIFYCSKYNFYKDVIDEIGNNEPLRMATAELEILRESYFLASSSASPVVVKDLAERVSALEADIMTRFNLSEDELSYTSIGLKVWRVDNNVKLERSEDGKVTFIANSSSSSSEDTISARVNSKKKSNDIFRRSYFASKNMNSGELAFSSKPSLNKMNNSENQVSSKAAVSKQTETEIVQDETVGADNYFRRADNTSEYKSKINNSFTPNNTKSNQFKRPPRLEPEITIDNNISDQLNKLKEERLSTAKALSDSIASAKENSEISKLREELSRQTEEISKLTSSKKVVSNDEEVKSIETRSNDASFMSPLASAMDNSFIRKSSDDSTPRSQEGSPSRNFASDSTYAATPNSVPVPSSSSVSSTGASASLSSFDDSSSVSGISLSTLKTIGNDVQVMDSYSAGVGRPIVIDASFAELSEEEKRAKIEALISEADEEEVFIEFPDGKILKFLKKDVIDNKKKVTDKDIPKEEKRNIFSYDNLKNIIDNVKD